MKPSVYFFAAIFSVALRVNGQNTGMVSGKVTDGETVLEFATVIAYQGSVIKSGIQTDMEGNFTIRDLEPGNYVFVAKYIGNEVRLENVVILPNQLTRLDLVIEIDHPCICPPAITYHPEIPQLTPIATFTQEEIRHTGFR